MKQGAVFEMSQTSQITMELREDDIANTTPAATALLQGFDHTPRIAKAKDAPTANALQGHRHAAAVSQYHHPGLVTRRTARSDGVQLLARIEGADAVIRSGLTARRPPRCTAIAPRHRHRPGGGRAICGLRRDWPI